MAECILMKSGTGTGSDECTATKANVLSGKTAVTSDSDDEATGGTMPNKGTWTSRIGVNGKAVIPAGYHNGAGYVDQAINNRGAVSASLGINGTYAIPEGYHNGAGKVTQGIATMGAQTVTPGNSQKVVSCSGKYMTGNVTVPAVSNLVAANIKKGVVVGGVAGTWEGYVANPTDLYYNGANSAGFVRSDSDSYCSVSFESTFIKVDSTTTANNSARLLANRPYNFAGYTNLQFTIYLPEGANKNDVAPTRIDVYAGILETDTCIGRLDLGPYGGQNVTLNLSLSKWQTNVKLLLSVVCKSYQIQIKRIRLA